LAGPAFLISASYALASSGRRASSSSDKYSTFFAFGPSGPSPFFFSGGGELLLEPASVEAEAVDASGCADGGLAAAGLPLGASLPPAFGAVLTGFLPLLTRGVLVLLLLSLRGKAGEPAVSFASRGVLPLGFALRLLLSLAIAILRGSAAQPSAGSSNAFKARSVEKASAQRAAAKSVQGQCSRLQSLPCRL
jgi:hypothetical protein